MVIDNVFDYRDDRYTSIFLVDDDPTDMMWCIMKPGYNQDNKDESLIEYFDKEIIIKAKIRALLVKSNKRELTDNIFFNILTFGGININEETGNWRSFIKLT